MFAFLFFLSKPTYTLRGGEKETAPGLDIKPQTCVPAYLYRSVHVDVRQERLADPAQEFGVEVQNLLLHTRWTLQTKHVFVFY